jgi:hypothetical protein
MERRRGLRPSCRGVMRQCGRTFREAFSEGQLVGCMREYEYSVQNSSLIESDNRTGGFLLSSSVPCICTLRPSASWMGSMQRPLLHEKVGGCCFDAWKTVQPPPPSELLSEVGLEGGGKGKQGRCLVRTRSHIAFFWQVDIHA